MTNKISITMTRRTAIRTSNVWIAMVTTIMRGKSPEAGKRRRKIRTTIMTYTTQRARKRRLKVRRKTYKYSQFS